MRPFSFSQYARTKGGIYVPTPPSFIPGGGGNACESVDSIEPGYAPPAGGSSHVITCTGLTGTPPVYFGANPGASVQYNVPSAGKITCNAPAGSAGQIVTISVADAALVNGFDYTVFQADWGYATGAGTDALRDNGKFASHYMYTDTMEVVTVPGSPPATFPANALRCEREGEHSCWVETAGGTLPTTGTVYIRFFVYTDVQDSTVDHCGTFHVFKSSALALLYGRLGSTASGSRPKISAFWDGEGTELDYCMKTPWLLNTTTGVKILLPHNQWYRFDYKIVYNPNSDEEEFRNFKQYPLIHNAADELLYDYEDYTQTDWGVHTYRGSNKWTLKKWYDAGYEFRFDVDGAYAPPKPFTNSYQSLERIAFGDNGPYGGQSLGQYTHYAAVLVRTRDWCGPYQSHEA